MDGGIDLTQDEVKGRNTWNLWCAGTEQFWERMSREGYGLIDLLKTIDSRGRSTRFKDMGLINEPGYKQASKPDQYGVWIDEPEPSSIDPKVYVHSTGIMGFRLFENPDFKGEAVKKWDANRYYNDPNYAVDPKLVRPYRVGISCGSCHIAFNPSNPPDDPENPKWPNLASAIGNQYLREGPIFAHNVKAGGFFWEMLNAQPPGTSDTSRMATDNINNPNAINPIFLLGARVAEGEEETLSGQTLLLPVIRDAVKNGAKSVTMPVPHVLKDGADSVGVVGATLRVYINIGSYSQHAGQMLCAVTFGRISRQILTKICRRLERSKSFSNSPRNNSTTFFEMRPRARFPSDRAMARRSSRQATFAAGACIAHKSLRICERCRLIEPGNQPPGRRAVGIVFAAKLRAQQPLFRTNARDERRYNERREHHADPRTKGYAPPERVDE